MKLKSLEVIGLKKVLIDFLMDCGKLRAVHFEKTGKNEEFNPEIDEIVNSILNVRNTVAFLKKYWKINEEVEPKEMAEDKAEKLLKSLEEKIVRYEAEIAELQRIKKELQKILPEVGGETLVLCMKIEQESLKKLQDLSGEIEGVKVFVLREEDSLTVITVFPPEKSKDVEKLVKALEGKALEIFLEKQKLVEAIKLVDGKIQTLKEEFESFLRNSLPAVKTLYAHYLAKYEKLKKRFELLNIARNLELGEFFFRAEVWIPEEKVKEFEKIAKKYHLKLRELKKPAEEVPRIIVTSDAVSELLTSFLPLMPYTPYLPALSFLTFSAFFGVMLGDIGYGLLLLLMAFIWKNKLNRLFRRTFGIKGDFSKVILASAVFSIIFGFIYGEIFGDLPKYLGLNLSPLFPRLENPELLILTTAIAGAIHLTLSFFLKFIGMLRRGKFYPFFPAVIIAWILAIGGHWKLALLALTFGAILSGLKDLVELPSYFTNVISYTRLAAIGLVAAYLAQVINHFAFSAPLLLGLIIFILGHSFNFVFAVFDPFIQTLRLHLVEFLSKITEGGRKIFTPLEL